MLISHTVRALKYAIFAGIVCFLLLAAATLFGFSRPRNNGDIPPLQVPAEILTETELRAVIAEQQEYILQLTKYLNACSEGFVPNIMEQTGSNFALFAPFWCFEDIATTAGEIECPAFLIYDQKIIDEYGDPIAPAEETDGEPQPEA
jgi:hypothetical protein